MLRGDSNLQDLFLDYSNLKQNAIFFWFANFEYTD